MVQCRMRKDQALQLLGGSVSAAADAIGVSYQAVDKWPEELPRRIDDRVIAACVRRGIAVPDEFIASDVAPVPEKAEA